MQSLKDKINEEGIIIEPGILKVDSFLNHQIDINLFKDIGIEFANRFKNKKIDKILSVEASGIALACFTSLALNNIPVVYAKKDVSLIISEDSYSSEVYSFTKKRSSLIKVNRDYLLKDENVLIIDDFLANGQAAMGLIDIVRQAKARVVGIGIVIEKGFQGGREIIESEGFQIESLAIIEEFKNGKVRFK